MIEMTGKKIIWSGSCKRDAEYHKKTNKHWAKLVTSIEGGSTSAYGFQGKWLKYHSQNEVNESDYILEFTHDKYEFYKAGNLEKKVTGYREGFITFRDECISVFFEDDTPIEDKNINDNEELAKYSDAELIDELHRRGLVVEAGSK